MVERVCLVGLTRNLRVEELPFTSGSEDVQRSARSNHVRKRRQVGRTTDADGEEDVRGLRHPFSAPKFGLTKLAS